MIAGSEPPFREEWLDVEERLQGDANAPEEGGVDADSAGQAPCRRQFAGVGDAEKAKGDDSQDYVTAVDEIHLPVQFWQAFEFVSPIELKWHE